MRIHCPECDSAIDVDASMCDSIEDVAAALLLAYKGASSVGDAIILAQAIKDTLVRLGASPGILPAD